MNLTELQQNVLDRRKTVRLSEKDVDEIIKSFSLLGTVSVGLSLKPNWSFSIFGRHAYKLEDHYVLFGSCDYCRTEKSPEWKYDKLFCSKCGVEIQ